MGMSETRVVNVIYAGYLLHESNTLSLHNGRDTGIPKLSGQLEKYRTSPTNMKLYNMTDKMQRYSHQGTKFKVSVTSL